MTKKANTQWHPAFCSAMRLELREDAEHLDYETEHTLNTKPLLIDLLIIKKIKSIELKNEIGKLFRIHNIVEFKSPRDTLNTNTYLKVLSYAYLYKTHETYVDDIKLEDITITMVRDSTPIKLLRWFRRNGYDVTETYPGIYYITKDGFFPTQVIVSKRLSPENQKWLTALRQNLTPADLERVIKQLNELVDNAEKIYGDSVWQVAMTENKSLINQLKGDSKMCQAMREFFAPELKEATERGMEREAKTNARTFFLNGATYELVRASIQSLSDEVLQQIYQEVKNNSAEAES